MLCTTLNYRTIERTTTVFRLLTVALGALGVVLGEVPVNPRLPILLAAYVTLTALHWLLAPRTTRLWLAYLMVVVDVGAVTAFTWLSLPNALPWWTLYFCPLASAAVLGRRPLVASAGLAVVGYLGISWSTIAEASPSALWPVVLLLATTLVLGVLVTRWLIEQEEKRTWQEFATAVGALDERDDLEAMAALVADRARVLIRADYAWLWWHGDANQLRPGPQVGLATDQPLLLGPLMAAYARQLGRGTTPVVEIDDPSRHLVGLIATLRYGEQPVALLALTWRIWPRDRAARRERLRVFAPWGGAAIAQAQERAAARQAFGRECTLRRAATDLVATPDRSKVYATVVNAARSGLGAAVALMERPSGHVFQRRNGPW